MATVTEPEHVDLVAYSLVVDPETNQILIIGYREGEWSLPGGGSSHALLANGLYAADGIPGILPRCRMGRSGLVI
jgi:hypothetical protein